MSILSGWSGEELKQLRELLFGTKEGMIFFSLFAVIAAGVVLIMVRIIAGNISSFTMHIQQDEERQKEEEQLEKQEEEGVNDEKYQ